MSSKLKAFIRITVAILIIAFSLIMMEISSFYSNPDQESQNQGTPATPTPKTVFKKKLNILFGKDSVEIKSLIDGNEILTTYFNKKSWGVWNIFGWYVFSNREDPFNTNKLMAGGWSDWEYVYAVAETKTDPTVFSGGNHGDEKLESLIYMNSDTGEIIDTDKIRSVDADGLTAIERTSLYGKKDFGMKYAEVERTYRFKGEVIEFEAKVNFTADVYLGTSYVCMLPMPKDVGRNILFVDTGDYFTMPKDGTTQTNDDSNNYAGMIATKSVIVSGSTKYKFRAAIGNTEMVGGFQNAMKVFYWDVNTTDNKLYFSRYSEPDYTLVRNGETQLLQSSWEIYTDQKE